MEGDDKLPADVQAILLELTAQWMATTDSNEKDRLHRLADDYRNGKVKPTNQITASDLQSDISTVLSDSRTSQLAKDIINNSVLGTFMTAPNSVKDVIVGSINDNIQGNRNQLIQAFALFDALSQTSNNLSTIQNQSNTWYNIAGVINPLLGDYMQEMAYGQMAGVEALLLSNGVIQGDEYITYMLANAAINGVGLDTRTISKLKESLLSVESYNEIYQSEKEIKIKQTSSALLDAIPGVNSLKSMVQMFTGNDIITGEPQSIWQRGFNVSLALLDVKAFKSLASVGKTVETWGGKTLEELASLHLTDSGQTVLGRFVENGGYIAKAQKMNASYYDIGDIWNLMAEDKRWATNTRFLDTIAERGDQVYLSVSKQNIIPGTYLAKEVSYLTKEKGYTWVNQWSLVKK